MNNNDNWFITYEKMINGEKKIINTYGRIVDETDDTFVIEEGQDNTAADIFSM